MNSNQLNKNEYAPYFEFYLEALRDVNLLEVLESSLEDLLILVKNLPEEKLQYRYKKGKWTIKELLQHLIDTERILCYRALRFSRNDTTELQGFNENWYVSNSNGNDRSFIDLQEELMLVRKGSISLFKSFTKEMQIMIGTTNGSDMTVRALGFIIAGHQLHHVKIIKEQYL